MGPFRSPPAPRLLVAGLVLLLLGVGNWSMGTYKMRQYGERMSDALAAGGEAVTRPFRGTASILERRSDVHELYEKSLIKRNQYRIIHRGGRMLALLGSLLILGALARGGSAPVR